MHRRQANRPTEMREAELRPLNDDEFNARLTEDEKKAGLLAALAPLIHGVVSYRTAPYEMVKQFHQICNRPAPADYPLQYLQNTKGTGFVSKDHTPDVSDEDEIVTQQNLIKRKKRSQSC